MSKPDVRFTINVYGYGDARSPKDWRDDQRLDVLLDLAVLLFPDNDVDMDASLVLPE